jgi:hypothetical protein
VIGPANLQGVAGCTCLAMAEFSPDILEPTGRGFLPSLHRPRTPESYLYGSHKSDRNPDLSLICTTVQFNLAGAEGSRGPFTFGAHHVQRKLSLMRSLEIRKSGTLRPSPILPQFGPGLACLPAGRRATIVLPRYVQTQREI